MSLDKGIQDAERTATAAWKLGAIAIALFSAGFASNAWLTRDVVRFGDKVFLDVEFENTKYRVNADMGVAGGATGQPLYVDSRPQIGHNFTLNRVDN